MRPEELFDKFREDELADQAELYGKMSVAEYSKWRSVAPQLVYYRIRCGRIKPENCQCCGRKVIDVREADVAFGRVRTEEQAEETEESSGGGELET